MQFYSENLVNIVILMLYFIQYILCFRVLIYYYSSRASANLKMFLLVKEQLAVVGAQREIICLFDI